jgi:alkylation response protein AidB-like acyl-CoA dehydrogenase
MQRNFFEADHDILRETVEHFVEAQIVPFHARWSDQGKVDRATVRAAGAQGLLGVAIPERYGGGGVEDFRYNAVIDEVMTASGAAASSVCITLHNDVCVPYFLAYANEEQRERWFPGLVTGELMTAIAMTEPRTGSDLSAIAMGAGGV